MKTENNLQRLILSALMILLLVSCLNSKPLPTSTAVSPTPTTQVASVNLPGNPTGFFLVTDEKTFPIKAQHLTEHESIYGYGLPQTDDYYPTVVFNQDSINPNNLLLRRMIGGIGFSPQPDTALGGVLVQGTRPGFGAETGGLRAGDLILTIDGQPLKEMLNSEDFGDRFGTLITGELGSQVKLTVKRENQELDLNITRNLPTFLSVSDTTTGSIQYLLIQGKDNVTQLVPESALSAGLYCYQSGASSTSFGDLYCFIQGNLDVAWPVPPASIAVAPSTRHDIFASPDFEKTDCRFLTLGQVVECGDLNVPEDYTQPEGKMIQLHVAVFRSSSDPQPDPVIYLHGGPGAGALEWMPAVYSSGLQYLFPNRDFIVFDQRGTGYSEPRLDCPSLADEYTRSLSEGQHVSSLGWETAHIDICLKDLEKRGVNLASYTTMASAADLDALIKALGYKQVNLFGQSYGTYLALTYMREYGREGLVRSAVLDGVSPPQNDFIAERGKNAQAAWDAIFSACEASPACRKAYPDIQLRFYELLDRLATQPIRIQTTNPYNGQIRPIIVNDFVFLEALYRSSYKSDWIPKIPTLIAKTSQGNTTLLEGALPNIIESAYSVDQGTYYAVTCGNAASFTREEAIQVEISQLLEPLQAYFKDVALGTFNLCRHWPVAPAAPTKNQPVASDIPILLLSGAFDPATSPVWARLASKTLSKGYFFEFPVEAHDLFASNSCAQRLTYKFVENPVKPQDACLDHLSGPVFETP